MRDKENWEIAEDATVCRIFGSATDRPREKVVMLLQVHFSHSTLDAVQLVARQSLCN